MSNSLTAVAHRRVLSNYIEVHIAEAGQGPLVVLLHGFAELWYSWPHQLPALADAGYHVVAPDLRGYGETDAPEAVEDYSMLYMTADVVGLLDAMDAERAGIVGHDWGANIAWDVAKLYPRRWWR
jgi:pimeloyl-ACP methyl ester carboxylesterase